MGRLLIGWTARQRAIARLADCRDHGAAIRLSTAEARWEAARNAVRERAAWVNQPPRVADPPPQLATLVKSISAGSAVRAMVGHDEWRVAVVDTSSLIARQAYVTDDDVLEDAPQGQDDWEALFATCLPYARVPKRPPFFRESFDHVTKSFTIASSNKNLRVIRATEYAMNDGRPDGSTDGAGDADADALAGQGRRFFGFVVGIPPSFVRVVDAGGRLCLRDGHQRCYALLKRGVSRVPCILSTGNESLHSKRDDRDALSQEAVFGERPPTVADFLNPRVSVAVDDEPMMKVVRIAAQEFQVQRPSLSLPVELAGA